MEYDLKAGRGQGGGCLDRRREGMGPAAELDNDLRPPVGRRTRAEWGEDVHVGQ